MPRHVPENAKLLFGPYEPPPLQKGDRTTCLYRDALVVVTSWSDGRISWPRCRALGHRGGSGLLVDEELARAIRSESAAALMYWCGVANSTVILWRTALGVKGLTGTEGTRRLVQAGHGRRVAKLRARPRPPEQVEQRRRTARELNLGQHLEAARQERGWPGEHLALLGTMPDAEVAERTGRLGVVRVAEHAAADAQHQRPVPLHQRGEGRLFPVVEEARKQLPIGQAAVRQAQVLKDALQAAGTHVCFPPPP